VVEEWQWKMVVEQVSEVMLGVAIPPLKINSLKFMISAMSKISGLEIIFQKMVVS
jgi:hypothetical protein